jgi:RimJ/RimL family protein N-acetyltransferase
MSVPPPYARDFTGLTLHTERLILRPWTEADIDAITEACQDPLIARTTLVPSPYVRANAEAFVRETMPRERAAGTGAGFGAFVAGTTEAVREVCRWAVEDLGVAVIRWEAIVGNEASWRVARKVGFVREGTRRAQLVHRDVRVDTWMGSLLRADLRSAQRSPR